MAMRIGYWALFAAIGAGGLAAAFEVQKPRTLVAELGPPPVTSAPADSIISDVHRGPLPPGHPPLDTASQAAPPPPAPEPATITWKPPTGWSEAPNASSMRLATYRIPRAAGDDVDAELTISRAGGSADANIERWVGQFDDAGKDERTERTVRGLKISAVEVGGTYLAGGMSASSVPARHPGFRLLGAVVEAEGTAYFFKLTGPAKTVAAARPAFDAMLGGVAPVRREGSPSAPAASRAARGDR